MIRIENLVKTYGSVRALDGLSLEVKAGQVYGFLGPNGGAGKSTTILSTLGLIFPPREGGKIQLFDTEVFNGGKFNEGGELVRAKARIGYMPEHATLWDFLTPVQTLDTIADASGYQRPNEGSASRNSSRNLTSGSTGTGRSASSRRGG